MHAGRLVHRAWERTRVRLPLPACGRWVLRFSRPLYPPLHPILINQSSFYILVLISFPSTFSSNSSFFSLPSFPFSFPLSSSSCLILIFSSFSSLFILPSPFSFAILPSYPPHYPHSPYVPFPFILLCSSSPSSTPPKFLPPPLSFIRVPSSFSHSSHHPPSSYLLSFLLSIMFCFLAFIFSSTHSAFFSHTLPHFSYSFFPSV